jgi:hypothetical protein
MKRAGRIATLLRQFDRQVQFICLSIIYKTIWRINISYQHPISTEK